ncbi:MAG: DUF1491 family protein [Sphingomonadaceae bacterium]
MSDARLTSTMVAGALVRLADQVGGFAVIIAKGDATSGALLVQILEKGEFFGLFERQLDRSGAYVWARTGPQEAENKELFQQYLDRRQTRDPDLWIVELDVPDAERFVADRLSHA